MIIAIDFNYLFSSKQQKIYQYSIYQLKKVQQFFKGRQLMEAPKNNLKETSDSFNIRQPFSQRTSDNMPFVSQIQDQLSTLIHKRNQLKELKLIETNYKKKGNDQQLRIQNLQIQMDHLITKEGANRQKNSKLEREVFWHRQNIKQLIKQLQLLKYDSERSSKNTTNLLKTKDNICAEFQGTQQEVAEKQEEKWQLETQNSNLQHIIIKNENMVRQKQDVLANLKIQNTQQKSLLEYIEERIINVVKTRNYTLANNKNLDQEIGLNGAKVFQLKKKIEETQWVSGQLENQNAEVQELNDRLLGDLNAAYKHLATVEKTNKQLTDSLQEFGCTGDKLTRMINLVKTNN